MSDILGHDQAMQRFLRGMRENSLHHAWLLYGPQGIGKATLARAMAAAYLCEKSQKGVNAGPACGHCHTCHMLAAESHPDFLYVERELDRQGKKKRDISVEQARKLLSFLSLCGAESMRRVVLLNEAALLNKHAANALLKGLEEPQPGSLLLIVCDDIMRLPATMRSRCMLERLAPLAEEECARVLQDMGLVGEALVLGNDLAAGRPGSVASLQDEEITVALLQWRQLTRDLAQSNIGAIQDWLFANISRVPHHLISGVVLKELYEHMQRPAVFAAYDVLMDAAWALAAWPERVARHSLRAGPALLAHMLGLRIALRDMHSTS